jgi:iron complex transport system ATP-binding protein
MSAILEAESLSVLAGRRTLLDRVSLSFQRGQTVAVIGPNGAGKSTLLRALSGEIRLQSGTIYLNGTTIASYPPHVLARHRAVLSQQVNITFPFTVAEVVGMGANAECTEKSKASVDSTLAELDLLDRADQAVNTLSGGEQQRVHFARVLVQLAHGQDRDGYGIMLLDEPTANLDLRHQLSVLDIAKRRAMRGALVIAIFHDLNLAALFATHVIVLNRGSIHSQGPPEETITDLMLARVFAIETTVRQLPATGGPFVLPQTMTVAKHFSL